MSILVNLGNFYIGDKPAIPVIPYEFMSQTKR